jgi:hypothetical protein
VNRIYLVEAAMSKKRKNITTFDRDRWRDDWLKNKEEGNYKPYFNTRDIASSGNKHRVAGLKSGGRVHHLLSTNEYFQFLHLEFDPNVKNIYDQYLLPLDETKAIANELDVKHPKYQNSAGKPDSPVTTDFVVEYHTGVKRAISVKAKSALKNNRTLEKQTLERAYWETNLTQWNMSLDVNLKTNMSINLELLYPFKVLEPIVFYEVLSSKWLPNFFACLSEHPDLPLSEVIEMAANNIGVEYKTSANLFFNAIWNHLIIFDFNKILQLEMSANELEVMPNDCH